MLALLFNCRVAVERRGACFIQVTIELAWPVRDDTNFLFRQQISTRR